MDKKHKTRTIHFTNEEDAVLDEIIRNTGQTASWILKTGMWQLYNSGLYDTMQSIRRKREGGKHER